MKPCQSSSSAPALSAAPLPISSPRSGARVQVLEPRAPGQGATRASAGILAPYIEGHGSARCGCSAGAASTMFDAFIARAASRQRPRPHLSAQRHLRTGVLGRRCRSPQRAAVGAVARRRRSRVGWRRRTSTTSNRWPSTAARGALLIPTHGFVGVTSLTLAAVAAAQKLRRHVHDRNRRHQDLRDAARARRRRGGDALVGSRPRRAGGRELVVA